MVSGVRSAESGLISSVGLFSAESSFWFRFIDSHVNASDSLKPLSVFLCTLYGLFFSVTKDMEKKDEPRVTEDNSPGALFCKSLIQLFKKISPQKQNMRARMKVMQTLLEFCDEDED